MRSYRNTTTTTPSAKPTFEYHYLDVLRTAIATLEDEKRMNYFRKIYPDLDFNFPGLFQASSQER
jgi:hypothetical protein